MTTHMITVSDSMLDGPELRILTTAYPLDGYWFVETQGVGLELTDTNDDRITTWIQQSSMSTGRIQAVDAYAAGFVAADQISWVLNSWMRQQLAADPSFTLDQFSWIKIADFITHFTGSR